MPAAEEDQPSVLDPELFTWEDLAGFVEGCQPGDYLALNGAFASATAQETASEPLKILCRMLADICFLHLEPARRNAPYAPAIQLAGGRSFAIDDLSGEQLNYLNSVAGKVERPDLRARVCDILWLRRRDLGVGNAIGAITAYTELSLPGVTDVHSHFVIDCWDRALCLARLIRGAGEGAIEPIERAVNEALDFSIQQNPILAWELSSVALRYGLGLDLADARSQAFQHAAEQHGNTFHTVRTLLTSAMDWESRQGRNEKYWLIARRIAQTHEHEADALETSEHPSYMHIAACLEQAIQAHRVIPRRWRPQGFDEYMSQLRFRHAGACSRAVEEFSAHEGDPIDLTELATRSRARVSGKDGLQALLGLISLFPIPPKDEFLVAARKATEGGSFSSFIGRTRVDESGRTIARTPAVSEGREEEVVVIRATETYAQFIEVLVKGAIIPALDAFNREHCVRERELLPLVLDSAAVPPGREKFFSKGLAAGFDWDFMTSTHLLVPQLENFLRYHIQGRGGETTVMSPEGIQSEASLGALLDMEEALDILGPNLIFALDSLLLSAHGPNFRNLQAHGLTDMGTSEGPHAVFIWWLCLHLVVLPFWSVGKSSGRGGAGSSPPD